MNDPFTFQIFSIGATCGLAALGIMTMFPGAPPVTRLARISSASLFAGATIYCAGYLVSAFTGMPWPGRF